MSDDKKQYVVTGHMAVFDTMTDTGRMRVTLYKGARVPDDATAEQIEHNLSVNLVTEIPGSDPAGIDSVGEVVVGNKRVDGGEPGASLDDEAAADKAKADDEAEQRRAEARAKLDEIGGTPDGRSSDAVMVEYLVKNGYDRAEAEKADRNQLKQLVGSVTK